MTCRRCSTTIDAADLCPICSTPLADTPRAADERLPPTLPLGAEPLGACETSSLRPGLLIAGRYEILGLAGRGGMGEVYRARDLLLNQTVALKLLREEMSRDERSRSRFLNEVRSAHQVSHPNVCRVHDAGEADGRQFLSMEFIEGEDLASLVRRRGRLPVATAIAIARQVCAGLAAAHERGVLHRDLKPSNVMVDHRGLVRLVDFGLAEAAGMLGENRGLEGTPFYMSPEQLAGDEATPRSDLYALGLVLYEIFAGVPPFKGNSREEILAARRQPPPPLSRRAEGLAPGAARVIHQCLEADPARRPASAKTLIAALPGDSYLAPPSEAARRRADRIAAFHAELADLRRAGVIDISESLRDRIENHHTEILGNLLHRFDIDPSGRSRLLSPGARVASLIGATALAASLFYFFYRYWSQ